MYVDILLKFGKSNYEELHVYKERSAGIFFRTFENKRS